MKKIIANNILWVEYWIGKVSNSCEEYEITAQELLNGKWKCEIELPLINETVASVSATEVNAILNASAKAAKLIKTYASTHLEINIPNRFKGKPYYLESNNGRYIRIGLSSEYRKKQGEQLKKMANESTKAIQRAISRIKKINGSDQDLYIQVLDKSLFAREPKIDDADAVVQDFLETKFEAALLGVSTTIDENHIIFIGYTKK